MDSFSKTVRVVKKRGARIVKITTAPIEDLKEARKWAAGFGAVTAAAVAALAHYGTGGALGFLLGCGVLCTTWGAVSIAWVELSIRAGETSITPTHKVPALMWTVLLALILLGAEVLAWEISRILWGIQMAAIIAYAVWYNWGQEE
ncbi:hypothetical protein BOTBODRAFT_178744 [Botryobasidium botryosum FD-172 SS1]|uniref:Uncharacterized protein n=1 Tax=Botryobasidium botryosum (strain FD-172 SS1) TaxID=930990 RepID=A0A067M2S4_BOTB1|nr:hypothetical protein BOTBODRAFT_178744 [Botryobasidium botryosum FD-172 SS1]